ncbi:hypothetical protein CQW23_13133 [Capsicum baccatum]|uniref:Uncharacterized protein n=1 Tax=Capsicum baccatum TaxID=33114 RepID=A0A2G2WUL4_CAPBA|nr:hypothetical protein CQW23_13133 [Capsicum baccatum]
MVKHPLERSFNHRTRKLVKITRQMVETRVVHLRQNEQELRKGAVFSYFVMAANHRPKTAKELRVLMDIYRVATILQFLSMSAVVIAFITALYATLSH